MSCRKLPNGGGHYLGPVGGRLVSEVLVGLAYYDRHSLLWQRPQWQPLSCPLKQRHATGKEPRHAFDWQGQRGELRKVYIGAE